MGKKGHCFWGAFAACGWDVNPVAAVVGHGWAQVPAGDAVRRPGGALGRGFIREDAAAWGPQRRFVEIECTVDLGVGG